MKKIRDSLNEFLDAFLSDHCPSFKNEKLNLFFNNHLSFVKLIMTFLIAILLFIIVVISFPFMTLFYLIRDIYNLYNIFPAIYRIVNKKKFLKNIESKLYNYERKLLSKEGIYKLDDMTSNNIRLELTILEDFIFNFINEYNYESWTFRVKDLKKICGNGKRRSLGDIFLICKYYFPNCSLYEVLMSIIRLQKKGKIAVQKCNDIKKYTFYPVSYGNFRTYNEDLKVEYFKNITISFKELKEALLKNEKSS